MVDFGLLPKTVHLCDEFGVVDIGILGDCLILLLGVRVSLKLVWHRKLMLVLIAIVLRLNKFIK